jgi:hypothetical protein
MVVVSTPIGEITGFAIYVLGARILKFAETQVQGDEFFVHRQVADACHVW